MRLEEFDYHLPEELIAQEPCVTRDQSRMMVVSRKNGGIENKIFHDLPAFLKKGDVLVVNDSKVIPARLIGEKASGGKIEILLLKKYDTASPAQTWEVLLRPAKRIRVGTELRFPDGYQARVEERIGDRKWLVTFSGELAFDQFLHQYGKAPLPPYIKRRGDCADDKNDMERYQTLYAMVPGSVAAPTAGLHFSRDVLDRLKCEGVKIASVTLHVGYGTFLPLERDIVEDHVMEEEFFEIGEEAAEMINGAERVIAVGTTSTRVLETVADEQGRVRVKTAFTKLFIYPGYRFKRVNMLLTNFHLPRSSLFLLVCAFVGKELIWKAYQGAIDDRYRFYSYGDCTLIM
ncbi:MAG: tRNA preQ1(34) S-adenosylmethionine ribosyltransferase-isomerase QueA [Syntrophales bacterium]|nr:tRNA preQ1(34) S-adenosylmethionine ribosyltransferase-isomerase QueA [Syntrophales bacterium]